MCAWVCLISVWSKRGQTLMVKRQTGRHLKTLLLLSKRNGMPIYRWLISQMPVTTNPQYFILPCIMLFNIQMRCTKQTPRATSIIQVVPFVACPFSDLIICRRSDCCSCNLICFLGYDNRVHAGKAYTGFSNWDVFRAEWAFINLFAPERIDDMIQSMLQTFEQGGRLPMWQNIVETNIMIGTHSG